MIEQAGKQHTMAGLLPGVTQMTEQLTMGYRQLRAQRVNWLWRKKGEGIRGHEFHCSVWHERPPTRPYLYQQLPWKEGTQPIPAGEDGEGVSFGSVIAAYTHLDFLAQPQLAVRFVAAARQVQPWPRQEGRSHG